MGLHLFSGERLRALGADRGGAAAIEAALVMPMLLVSMAGLIDGSRALMQSMQVRNAAHAGTPRARRDSRPLRSRARSS